MDSTIIAAIIGLIGTLLAVWFAHYLNERSKREQPSQITSAPVAKRRFQPRTLVFVLIGAAIVIVLIIGAIYFLPALPLPFTSGPTAEVAGTPTASSAQTGVQVGVKLEQIELTEYHPSCDSSSPLGLEVYYDLDISSKSVANLPENEAVDLSGGEVHTFPPTAAITVNLHFDGRDEIRITGNIQDDDGNGDDLLGYFNQPYRWQDVMPLLDQPQPHPIEPESYARVEGQSGEACKATLYVKFIKGEPLFD